MRRYAYLALVYVSQPYLNFVRWMIRTKNPIGAAVIVLWFYGGLVLYLSSVIYLGQWIFGESTWPCRIFIFGMSLLMSIYHFFYIFPRRFEGTAPEVVSKE